MVAAVPDAQQEAETWHKLCERPEGAGWTCLWLMAMPLSILLFIIIIISTRETTSTTTTVATAAAVAAAAATTTTTAAAAAAIYRKPH